MKTSSTLPQSCRHIFGRLSFFLATMTLLASAAMNLSAQNCVQFLDCPSNKIAYACGSNCVPVTFDLRATNYCNPTNVVVVSDYPSGYCFPLGTTWVHANAYGSGYSNSCTFPVTVLSNCPPPTGNCFTLSHGTTTDDFAGPEPASPRSELVANLAGVDLREFDDGDGVDAFFADSFAGLPPCIVNATLRIRVKANAGLPENDTISLGFAGSGGALDPVRWTRRIGTYAGTPGLLPMSWSRSNVVEFVLDVSHLPLVDGSFTDLLPTLTAKGYLDIWVQDDTSVDSVTLEVCTNSCAPSTCLSLFCPTNPITAYACGSNCVPVNFSVRATNYCNPSNVVVTTDYPSGYCFPLGTTWVHATAYGSGYSNSCSFSVTVLSNCPPQGCSGSIQCPPDIVTNVCPPSPVPLYYAANITHSCSPLVSVVYDPPRGSLFGPGSHWVNCTAYFGDGTSLGCSFNVTVTTNCPSPEDCIDIQCPTNLVRYACGSNCVSVPFTVWATDRCSSNEVSVATDYPSGYCFPLGTTWVNSWAYGSGQSNQCSFSVTVLPDPNCGGGNGDCSTNLLVNGSFERPALPDGYVALPGGNSTIEGWITALNGVEYYNPVAAPLFVNTGVAADGNYLLDLAPLDAMGGCIKQTFATVPGNYRVSFAMGTSKERGRLGRASLTVSVAGAARSFNTSAESPGITWERKEFSFVATSSTTTLVFSTMDDPALSFVNLDDVRVSDCCTDPGLRISRTVTVEWSCGILQSAPEVTGPYTDVPGATSPYTTPATGPQQYFRTR